MSSLSGWSARGRVLPLAVLIAAGAMPAEAVTIKPVFDSSITSRSNAAAIESAFNAEALVFDGAFANPATINITVSWGSVAGQSLGAGAIGGSLDNLSGAYSYSSVASYLTAASKANPRDVTLASAVAHLPKTDPTRKNAFEVPYAEAKAIGMLPPTLPMQDGYIGFSTAANFDFNPVGGITAGTYDFKGLAGHEIEEVLGRITGLTSASATWATPFDLYRYAAANVSSFSYTSAAYFSVNGGMTNLGDFNISGGGDRSDWLSVAGSTELQNAYLSTGTAYTVSSSDLTALDALGWGVWKAPAAPLSAGPSRLSSLGGALAAVPEPSSWGLLILGFGCVGAITRRRRQVERAAVAGDPS